MQRKKTILLTNDDGYAASGIKTLFDTLKDEFNIVVVAPESEKSGVSHSFTYHNPLFYEKITGGFAEEMYSVSGSPADCVKFAVSHLLTSPPDLVVSGLNLGENSGVSSHYSGTVAAAREGAFWKIRSFAFSVSIEAIDYSCTYAEMIPKIIDEILRNTKETATTVFYNVNFPPCSPDAVKGTRITRQSMAFFDDKYREIAVSRNGTSNAGYMIYGEKKDLEHSDEYDSRALRSGWITITPMSFDSTAHDELEKMKLLDKIFTC